MRLGIFGGSFDPVHNGHLALARACEHHALLDEIWFTPAAIQPLKETGPHATNAKRIEMLNLAIDPEQITPLLREPDRPRPRPKIQTTWRVCTLEIDRGGFSYTVETLQQIHTELPDAELFFLMGADAARDAPSWRQPVEIFRLARPLIVRRSDQSEPDLSALAAISPPDRQPQLVEMAAVDISSSEIRRRVAMSESIDGLVPTAVAQYIALHALYKPQALPAPETP
ncbi:MAG TPA: nicotinate-nicotinamide nucleotide adenylyltransferase [Lacipirellulaceae bacterium]|nr:nicotinate-nicotinamide nucleotide adenylyltransferase [Lacipirellulaceae bacterium]